MGPPFCCAHAVNVFAGKERKAQKKCDVKQREKTCKFSTNNAPPVLGGCTKQPFFHLHILASLDKNAQLKCFSMYIPRVWQDGVHLLNESTLALVEGKSAKVVDTRCARVRNSVCVRL